jgi:hypothetical protein
MLSFILGWLMADSQNRGDVGVNHNDTTYEIQQLDVFFVRRVVVVIRNWYAVTDIPGVSEPRPAGTDLDT